MPQIIAQSEPNVATIFCFYGRSKEELGVKPSSASRFACFVELQKRSVSWGVLDVPLLQSLKWQKHPTPAAQTPIWRFADSSPPSIIYICAIEILG
jgi:hypothetical protein